MYKCPAIRNPTNEELKSIGEQAGLQIDENDIPQYRDLIADLFEKFKVIDEVVVPPVTIKYPRTPGQLPLPLSNKLNAWAWKTDIKGASEGKLKGKRVAVKDSIAVAGVPMKNGSQLLEGYIPEYDATVVTRILDAGGHIVGKSTCENLCYSGCSITSSSGPVLNPHDTTRSAGGSSSGSAVLLATNEVDLALGADQGGSIRLPASWSGVVGLKPTYGLVPYTGCMSMERSLDHVGPMARNVHDCALLLEVIACYDDGLDTRQPVNLVVPNYTSQLTGDLAGLNIGIVSEGFDGCETDVADLVKARAFELAKYGARVTDINIPLHSKGISVGAKDYCFPSTVAALHAGAQSRIHELPPTLKMLMLMGEYLSKKYSTIFYSKGQNLSRLLCQAYDDALKQVDVLVMPTIKYKASKIPSKDASVKDIISHCSSNLTNTSPFNATGHPAISVNAGYSEGLPVGVMIIGRHFEDGTVLRVADVIEKLVAASGEK